MSVGRLTDLQSRLLRVLAAVTPPWTLTGGAALVGFYTAHRVTRDLDLFWPGLDALGTVPAVVADTLRREGLSVDDVQTAPTFHRLRVSDGREVVVVDLVAQRGGRIEAPTERSVGHVSVRVDSPHQILVNKITALLGRAELRDLEDVKVLLANGGDLPRALADAPRVDGGFSALTLAWILDTFPLRLLAARLGRDEGEVDALDRFRIELIERVTRIAADELAERS